MSLDPAREMEDFVRPKNKSGMVCPLNRKPVEEVCHKCELWQPLELTIDGKSKMVWNCSLVWPAVIATIQNFKLDGIQKATEQLSNKFTEFRASVAGLVGSMARAADLVEGAKPPQQLVEGDAEVKRISGNSD